MLLLLKLKFLRSFSINGLCTPCTRPSILVTDGDQSEPTSPTAQESTVSGPSAGRQPPGKAACCHRCPSNSKGKLCGEVVWGEGLSRLSYGVSWLESSPTAGTLVSAGPSGDSDHGLGCWTESSLGLPTASLSHRHTHVYLASSVSNLLFHRQMKEYILQNHRKFQEVSEALWNVAF